MFSLSSTGCSSSNQETVVSGDISLSEGKRTERKMAKTTTGNWISHLRRKLYLHRENTNESLWYKSGTYLWLVWWVPVGLVLQPEGCHLALALHLDLAPLPGRVDHWQEVSGRTENITRCIWVNSTNPISRHCEFISIEESLKRRNIVPIGLGL